MSLTGSLARATLDSELLRDDNRDAVVTRHGSRLQFPTAPKD
jgi:hypothetical protein